MIASRVHFPGFVPAAVLAKAGRLMRTILCLAGIAFVVVALRYGLYDHFHGDGRTLSGLWDAIRR